MTPNQVASIGNVLDLKAFKCWDRDNLWGQGIVAQQCNEVFKQLERK